MATLEASSGIGFSMMPPGTCACRGLVWRWATLMSSMMTLPVAGSTWMTVPWRPRSLPLRTTTLSPLRIFMSQLLRRQGHDAHETAVAQLAAHRAEDAGAARLHLVVDEHRRVLVETDIGTVRPAPLLLRAHD